MVIGKCTDVFRGIFWLGEGLKRGGYTGGTFHRGICHGGRKYPTLYAKLFLVISTIYSTAFVIQGSFLMNWDEI